MYLCHKQGMGSMVRGRRKSGDGYQMCQTLVSNDQNVRSRSAMRVFFAVEAGTVKDPAEANKKFKKQFNSGEQLNSTNLE